MSVNILLTYRHYPLTVARFFKWAFQRLGCKVFSAGPFIPTLPWADWRDYRQWWDVPDLKLPNVDVDDLDKVLRHPDVQAFKPDLLVQIDAGYWLQRTGNTAMPTYIHLATDAHCLSYDQQFQQCHVPVCMHKHWADMKLKRFNARWLPYAFDPVQHYYAPTARTHDVTILTGLVYPQRAEAMTALSHAGLRLYHDAGYIFSEGTEIYNRGLIAFNWSSNDDLPMRFWEGLAYRNVVLTNRVPDLDLLQSISDLKEGKHFLAYDTVEECVDKAKWAAANQEVAERIADAGYNWAWINRHTYTQRAKMLLSLGDIDA